MNTKVTFMVLKILGLAFFLVPILMSRIIMFSDISWMILDSLSVLGLIFLIVLNIVEWKSKRKKTNQDFK
ncbi:hypothetical protein [Neobacillus cucumis]|uniref:hypothetical protein n=1 Tax=Neobacillus cucumis TaxID=1740721 RepID=UPI001963CD42|nr:hypothetical protein [Neobacillus cucumis]MBM7656421.1 putative membrane protein [Neobacillus cucumis]